MASSMSKWIFQTAVFLLTFLIMMAEGIKCYQCAAADPSCKKGTKDQLKECSDCKTKTELHMTDGSSTIYANVGCGGYGQSAGPAAWRGCYSLIAVESADVKNKLTYTVLGCTGKKVNKCETYDTKEMQFKETFCYCDKEGCNQLIPGTANSRAGQKLSPKSSLLIFPLIITYKKQILQKIIFN